MLGNGAIGQFALGQFPVSLPPGPSTGSIVFSGAGLATLTIAGLVFIGVSTPSLVCDSSSTARASGTPSTPASTVAVPPGSNIVAMLDTNSLNDDIASVTDSAGNTYTLVTAGQNASAFGACIAYCLGTTANLPVGATFAATTVNGGLYFLKGVFLSPGITAVDTIHTVRNGAGTSSTLSSGVLVSPNEIAYEVISFGSSGGGIVTKPTSFTEFAFSNTFYEGAYQIKLTGTAPFIANPTWTINIASNAILVTFH